MRNSLEDYRNKINQNLLIFNFELIKNSEGLDFILETWSKYSDYCIIEDVIFIVLYTICRDIRLNKFNPFELYEFSIIHGREILTKFEYLYNKNMLSKKSFEINSHVLKTILFCPDTKQKNEVINMILTSDLILKDMPQDIAQCKIKFISPS
ncbi:hypothetical protein L3V80_06395 [Thiotrichales bacterium 19S9-11]|nr:hypothetical protein [Thiotrichales bacterium 19S9-11]